MKASPWAGPVLAAGVLAAACGCSAATSAPAATAAHAVGTSVPAAARAAAPQQCPASALQIKTAPGSGEAMDGVYWDLTFTNRGPASCTLYGYPGVSFLTAGRAAITAPATRTSANRDEVTLAPGQTASSQMKTPNVGNLPAADCRQAITASLEVYPPNDTSPVFVPFRIGVCAGRSPGGSVWPVVPGDHAGV